MNTSLGRYALGVVALLVVLGSLALAAVVIRRRWLADWAGAPARLAEVVIGLALLVGILELLGAVGLFELGPILVASRARRGWPAAGGSDRRARSARAARTWLGRGGDRGRAPRRRRRDRRVGRRSRSSPTTSASAGSTRSGTTCRGRRASRRPGASPRCASPTSST